MEFAGITLRDLHQQDGHQFTEDEICFIAWNLIDLLEALHNEGFVHQDIKPSNITLSFTQN